MTTPLTPHSSLSLGTFPVGHTRTADDKGTPAASPSDLQVREGMATPTALALNPFTYGVDEMVPNPLFGAEEPASPRPEHLLKDGRRMSRGEVVTGRRPAVIAPSQMRTPEGPKAVNAVLHGSPAKPAASADGKGPAPGAHSRTAGPALPPGASRDTIQSLSMDEVVRADHPYHAHLAAYLGERHALENLNFITATDAFMADPSVAGAQALAGRFIGNDTPDSVNLSSEAVTRLQEKLQTYAGGGERVGFEGELSGARAEILKVIKENDCARFLQHLQARLDG